MRSAISGTRGRPSPDGGGLGSARVSRAGFGVPPKQSFVNASTHEILAQI